MTTNKGIIINFEGIDGAGKSTHIPFVKDIFVSLGYEVVLCREPGGTKLGEKLREMVLHEQMHLETEALIMFASRRELLSQVIEPALGRGCVVISDRFSDSSYAFQVGGRGLSLGKAQDLENWVHPHLQPDLTLLFDAPIDIAQARISSTRDLDKFEREKRDFHVNVRNEYIRRSEEFPDRFRIINSSQSILEIQNDVRIVVEDFMLDFDLSSRNKSTRNFRP